MFVCLFFFCLFVAVVVVVVVFKNIRATENTSFPNPVKIEIPILQILSGCLWRLGTKKVLSLDIFFSKNLTQLLSFYFGCNQVTGREIFCKLCFFLLKHIFNVSENPTNKSH